jgi:hypothetical protein
MFIIEDGSVELEAVLLGDMVVDASFVWGGGSKKVSLWASNVAFFLLLANATKPERIMEGDVMLGGQSEEELEGLERMVSQGDIHEINCDRTFSINPLYSSVDDCC